MSTPITITGNVGSVDLRYTTGGKAVLEVTVAHNRRRMNPQSREWEDAGTDWYRAALWGSKAEAAADVVVKGARVIVTGDLESRNYDAASGTKTAWEIRASEVGVIPVGKRTPTPAQADPWATNDAPF